MKRQFAIWAVVAAMGISAAMVLRGANPPQAAAEGKRVTISAENMPLSAALVALREQSGICFHHDTADANLRVNYKAREVPLWEAIRGVMASAKPGKPVTWQMHDATDANHIPRRISEPMASSGPFLVAVREVISYVDFRLPEAETRHTTVVLVLVPDPSVRVLSVNTQAMLDSAVDENGGAYSAAPPPAAAGAPPALAAATPAGATPPVPLRGRNPTRGVTRTSLATPLEVSLGIRPPADPGKVIKQLNGRIKATLAGRTEQVELVFPGSTTRAIGGMQATITAESVAEGQYTVTTTAMRSGNLTEAQWIAMRNGFTPPAVKVFDAQGIEWPTSGGSSRSNPESVVRIQRFEFRGRGTQPGPPVKAKMDITLELEEVEIPFQLENVNLR